MADTKISDMTAINAVTTSDLFTVVQSGVNYKVTAKTIQDSFNGIYKAKVTVSSASLLTLGSVPVSIVAAPGSNKYLNILGVCCSYNYNSVAYDFSNLESPTFLIGATNATHQLAYTVMNQASDFNAILFPFSAAATQSLSTTNTALTLTTSAGTDPTVGNGDLDVVVYYSIEDVNI